MAAKPREADGSSRTLMILMDSPWWDQRRMLILGGSSRIVMGKNMQNLEYFIGILMGWMVMGHT